jgi:hypothetical protein
MCWKHIYEADPKLKPDEFGANRIMRRRDILGLFVIATPIRAEFSELAALAAMPKRQFQIGQKVWASTKHIKCCGVVIGFTYLAPNEFCLSGWQYAVWVTDWGQGCPSQVEWFNPDELQLMTVEDLEGAIAPVS